jgi:hypothetical protein
MYQRDYILRMIEMMGDFIAAVLHKLRKEDYPEVERMIENAYYDFLKQDAAFFRNIPIENLTAGLIQEHHFSHGHLEILGELFYAEAEMNYQSGKLRESVDYYKKSLTLLEFVLQQSDTYSIDKELRLSEMKQRINSIDSTKI